MESSFLVPAECYWVCQSVYHFGGGVRMYATQPYFVQYEKPSED